MLLAVLAFLGAGPLEAQCTLAGTPFTFDPPPGVDTLTWGVGMTPQTYTIALYKNALGRRVVTQYSYGYAIYDLATPESPVLKVPRDIHANANYIRHGDGQYTVNAVGANPDGSMLLVNYNDNHGTLVMPVGSPGQPDNFGFGGDYPPIWPNSFSGMSVGDTVSLSPLRRMAYTVNQSAFYAADVTVPLTGTAATASTRIPSERLVGVPGGNSLNLAVNDAGTERYLVYSTAYSAVDDTGFVVVLDVSRPGPAGALTSTFIVSRLRPEELGLPRGTVVKAVKAAIHPTTQKLMIYAEASDAMSGISKGITLSSYTPSIAGGPGSISVAGRIVTLPAPYGQAGTLATSAQLLVATAADLIGMSWEYNQSEGKAKLFSFSANGWGIDLSPGVLLDASAGITEPYAMTGFASGTSIYSYVAQGRSSLALKVDCSLSGPAAANLAASAYGAAIVDGGNAFLGDTITVTPSVNPSPVAGMPSALTQWYMDLDYHAASETLVGTNPNHVLGHWDIGSTTSHILPGGSQYGGSLTLPPGITLVGPCDPRKAGYSTDAGSCWNSVVTNASTGGPDVPVSLVNAGTTVVPLANEGQSFPIRIGFEAANGFTTPQFPYGSQGLKIFTINWTVPRVSIQSSTVLLQGPVVAAAEGHPLAAGYRWYFASNPGDTTLLRDGTCNGASCNHAFPVKGGYKYWVTVPYGAGYSSEDCPDYAGGPCVNRSRGTITANDAVASFGAPTSIPKSQTTIAITDLMTTASAVLPCSTWPSAIAYGLCDGSQASCRSGASASYPSTLVFTGPAPPATGGTTTIPVPTLASYPGKVYLRIRFSYTTNGSTCGTGNPPTTIDWTPTVTGETDPKAWPITVTGGRPAIVLMDDATGYVVACNPVFGTGCPTVGQVLRAKLVDTSDSPASDMYDTTTLWSLGAGASPASWTGTPTATFTYSTIGSKTLTACNTAYGAASCTPAITSNPISPYDLYVAPPCGGNPVPPAPVGVPASRCGPGTVALSATGAGAAQEYRWYAASSGGTALQTGSALYTTPSISSTTSYYVSLRDTTTLCEGVRAAATATVNPIPSAPAAANDGPVCEGGALQLSAGTVSGASYSWTGPNGFTSHQQLPTIAGVTLAAAGTYSVTATVNGCTSAAGWTNVVVLPRPATPIIAAPASVLQRATGLAASVASHAGSDYAWGITNGNITAGQGTNRITFSVGLSDPVLVTVTEASAAGCTSLQATVSVPVVAGSSSFQPIGPCRLFDTRNASGADAASPILGPGETRSMALQGRCSIPAGAMSLAINMTTTGQTASGELILFRGDLVSAPAARSLGFRPGIIRANNGFVELARDGTGTIKVFNSSTGMVHLVLDVTGYFQ